MIKHSKTETCERHNHPTDKNGLFEFSYGDNIGGSFNYMLVEFGDNSIPVSSNISFRIILRKWQLIEIFQKV
jgi:hypothetical protein